MNKTVKSAIIKGNISDAFDSKILSYHEPQALEAISHLSKFYMIMISKKLKDGHFPVNEIVSATVFI